MKKWLILTVVMLCCLTGFASAEEAAAGRDIVRSDISAVIPVQGSSVEISASVVDGEAWLLLPSFADPSQLQLMQNGRPVAHQLQDDAIAAGETQIRLMQSQNVRALFLFSDDPVNEGREYIENCERHEHFTSAAMALIDETGRIDHSEAIRKLRGRGNGTWSNLKRPYQFKLESPADLLDTGLESEQERTWVLLTEASSQTMLHNRITLDMGLELGLTETPGCEFVDLYYDGEYRGLYLLAEKVEIGEGRVNELDYEDLIERWNDRVGQTDLTKLPVLEGMNRFGQPYTYLDGVVESASPDAGAYLVEMESTFTLSDPCYFTLHDGQIMALKNPESASQQMSEYISTRLQEARNTLIAGGVNPETGRTLEEDFDVDAFARTLLIQELSYNYDGYRYSSSFFVLPAGEKQFRPGPLWDFDIAYRYLANGLANGGVGFKDANGWMYDFYQCPAFVDAMRSVYLNELYPMVQSILLGDEEGQHLRSLDAYADHISAAREMNGVLWEPSTLNRYVYGRTHEDELALLRRFLSERSQWLYEIFSQPESENRVDLWVSAIYGHTDETLTVQQKPWNPLKLVGVHHEQVTEATEEDYAWWQLWVDLEGAAEITPDIYINGQPAAWETGPEGTVRVGVAFQDPSYRPVDYYGEDIGMIYNYDFYIQNHPEVAEECEYDPELVMDAFYCDGVYEDHMGNAFFRPSEVLAAHPYLNDQLGEDWWLYYSDFLAYGYETDKWLTHMGKCYWPGICSLSELP